jgi:DNA-binding NtrC family response regulator
MQGNILVYGNDQMLVTTRGLILEKADYRVFTVQTFANAMLALMNHQIDIVVLCQSLKDEERSGILETAHALQPEIKCAVLDLEEREVKLHGVDLIQGLEGPTALLSAIGKLLTQKVTTQTQTSN